MKLLRLCLYVVVSGENSDAEGLECANANGVGMRSTDTGRRQESRSNHSSGDALRHFSCSDET